MGSSSLVRRLVTPTATHSSHAPPNDPVHKRSLADPDGAEESRAPGFTVTPRPYLERMTSGLLAVSSDHVIAGSAALQTAGVLLGLWYARSQLREAAAARRDQGRAYVAVFFELHEDRRYIPDLTIRNFGETAAYDVTISVDPPLRSSFDGDMPLSEVGMLKDGIPTLPPGAKVSTIFDSILERPDDWELSYRAVVTYRDRSADVHEDEFVLDLAPHMGTHWVDRKGIHDVHDQLKKLTKEVHELRTGWGSPMPVVIEDRETYTDRRRAEREERQQLREERRRAADARAGRGDTPPSEDSAPPPTGP
jgi:hypothetical protein